MKLQDLAVTKTSKQISKVYESYFTVPIGVDKLSPYQTSKMLGKVRGLIKEHNSSTNRHSSERNPAYLKLVMMEQALSARLKEMAPVGSAPQAQQTNTAPGQIDPKLKAAQDKVKKGQQLNPEEQKMLNDAAAQLQENRLRRAYRTLKESEVQQAQVVLAAQDMVDKMQAMLEDATEMQFKELPALVDSIKNQVGIDQATQFNTDATAALTGLVQNLQGAKQQLDTALGVITGQAAPADAGLASMVSAAPGMEAGQDLEAAAGADLEAAAGADLEADAAPEPEAALGSAGALGRGRR
jgi:hypothetical protein